MTKSLAEVMRDKDMQQGVGAIIYDRVTNRMMQHTTDGWKPYMPDSTDAATMEAYKEATAKRYYMKDGRNLSLRQWEDMRSRPKEIYLISTELGDYTVLTQFYGCDDEKYETIVTGKDKSGLRWVHDNQRDAYLGHHKISDKLAENLGIE
jgi:RecA-family ATPase